MNMTAALCGALDEYLYHSDACSDPGTAIGVVIPTHINPFYPDIADKLRRAARAAGLHALVCNAQGSVAREAMCLNALLHAGVAGVIAMPVGEDSQALYAQSPSPVVLLGCRADDQTLGCVAMDDYRAGWLAAERLLAHGHRSLAFIGLKQGGIAAADRLEGYSGAVRACSQASLCVLYAAGDRLTDSYAAMLRLLEEGDAPTAIAAADDFTAIGAWQALRERTLPVGGEYALIGFGNSPFAALPKHGLSSIGPAEGELAAPALSLLRRMQKEPGNACRHMLLTPELFCRSTFCDAALTA